MATEGFVIFPFLFLFLKFYTIKSLKIKENPGFSSQLFYLVDVSLGELIKCL